MCKCDREKDGERERERESLVNLTPPKIGMFALVSVYAIVWVYSVLGMNEGRFRLIRCI